MIEIQNLSKKFGNNEVLKNVSLHFEKGRVYGIMGENGAGKTTLFRCISGLEVFNGKIISDLNPLKNFIGLLQTEPYFFSKITGREYIQLLSNARIIKINNIDERNLFDLPLDQYASTYSTGMKKKLAITAILLQKNEIFILDEPFNGVDIQSNIIITEIIHKLRQLNKTVIISSHIFSTLNDTCDQIHLLKEGMLNRTVNRDQFSSLENEIREITIGDKIEKFNL